MQRRWFGLPVLLVLVFAGSACGDDDSSSDTGGDDADVVDEGGPDVPVDVPADVPEDVPADVPADTPVDTPVDTPTDTPTDTPVDACSQYCNSVVAAGCTAGPPTVADCLTGCAAIVVDCPEAFATLATCAGEDPTITCDAAGTPVVTGCEADQYALLGCMAGGPCGHYCGQVMVAGCDETPASFAHCIANCAGSQAACSAAFDELSDCAGDDFTVTCDTLGRAAITGCLTEYADLMQCAVADPCTTLCDPAIEADCASGPPTLGECVVGCSEVAANGCIGALTALATCAGTDATASCNAAGLPVIDDCESENADYMACGAS